MNLLTIAEVMAGELLVSPGGLVDRATAVGDEPVVWQQPVRQEAAAERAEEHVLVAAGA